MEGTIPSDFEALGTSHSTEAPKSVSDVVRIGVERDLVRQAVRACASEVQHGLKSEPWYQNFSVRVLPSEQIREMSNTPIPSSFLQIQCICSSDTSSTGQIDNMWLMCNNQLLSATSIMLATLNLGFN